jgi:hypothetical protein
MLNRLPPRTRVAAKELLRRIDRAAADLNVLLAVVAIGLAALDMTFLLTRQVVDHLPVTRVVYDDPSSPSH